jgi:gamma-glutamylcyclotransferase (GGCT)/AIG2-like uncharacterized protein YtfP
MVARGKTMKLYFAYGANLNKEAMARRCPDAEPFEKFVLPNYKLVFKGVADVEECEGSNVEGMLWVITDKCEKALDRFEGYPYLYIKQEHWWSQGGFGQPIMFYVMRGRDGISPPNFSYAQTIKEGYEDFGLNKKQLKKAIAHSYENDSYKGYNSVQWSDENEWKRT